MTDLPRGTVTFLFTDIEGSTRLLTSLGSRYEAVLADHRKLLRAAFLSHAGIEVDTQRDALFDAFSRAQDAVAGAVAAQRAVSSHDFGDGVEVRVRMGIHTGEPTVTQEGYVGADVHLGARICAVAWEGLPTDRLPSVIGPTEANSFPIPTSKGQSSGSASFTARGYRQEPSQSLLRPRACRRRGEAAGTR